MTCERLILLCLRKKQQQKFQTHAPPSLVGRGAGHWSLVLVHLGSSRILKVTFFGTPSTNLQISGEVEELFDYFHLPSIVNRH